MFVCERCARVHVWWGGLNVLDKLVEITSLINYSI